MNKTILIPLLTFILTIAVNTQDDDVQIGSNFRDRKQSQDGLFDYSDPARFNIKVQLWDNVNYPVFYVVRATAS